MSASSWHRLDEADYLLDEPNHDVFSPPNGLDVLDAQVLLSSDEMMMMKHCHYQVLAPPTSVEEPQKLRMMKKLTSVNSIGATQIKKSRIFLLRWARTHSTQLTNLITRGITPLGRGYSCKRGVKCI